MPSFAQLDAITLEYLRTTGATKWNRADAPIGAFVAEMDYGIATPITETLHREVDRGLFAYLPLEYRERMQASVARYLRDRCAWEVAPECIHEMPDVVAAYRAAIAHFSEPGSKIIVPTPAYMPFLTVPGLDGREVIEVPMNAGTVAGAGPDAGSAVGARPDEYAFGDDLAALERAFDDGGGLLVLCNPHNPTGRVFTEGELRAIEELVDRKGGRVFSDEIWQPLIFSGARHIPYASLGERAAGHTVTAIAASKGFNLPGLKCAQLILSNAADAATWRDIGWLSMHGAANLGLAATAAAFDEGLDWLDDVTAYLERNRDLLVEFVARRMPGAHVTRPEGTYIAWLDFSAWELGAEPAEFFRERAGVLCTDGTACGTDWAGHVRFVFAMPQPVMIDALERMAAALERVGVA